MDPILQLLTQPIVILLIAVAVFVGRVVYLARRLKSASKYLMLADTRALEEAQRSLDAHRESLESARETVAENLGGARQTLREYKRPLVTSIESRRKVIEASMRKKEFEALRSQKPFQDAKKLAKTALPRKTHRASTKEM
jgi:hypothetical protein